MALLRLGAATSSVLRSGKFQYSATASGRRSVYPLPDCLVCWVPRLLSVEVALDPNEDFNHCQESSLFFLPLSVHGAVEARCVRAASPTHALEHGVLSRSPSAAERRSPTSCNNEFKVCLSVCLFFEHRNRGEIGPTVMAQSARRSSASAHAWTPSCQRLPRAPQHAHPA